VFSDQESHYCYWFLLAVKKLLLLLCAGFISPALLQPSCVFNIHVKWVHCHHGMARPRVAVRGDGLQIWRVAANILNKQSWTANSGWYSSLGLGGGLTTLPRETQYLLRTTTHSLGIERITWHNISTGKWT
jgi:hypothetical protein